MRSKDEIGRFSLQPSEKVTAEELEDHLTDGCDIYHVYLIGYMGYVRDQAQMLFDSQKDRAVIAWNGDMEQGDATCPETAAIQWIDGHLDGNGKS